MRLKHAITITSLLALLATSAPVDSAEGPISFFKGLWKPHSESKTPEAPALVAQRQPAPVAIGSGVNPAQIEAVNQKSQAHVQRQLGAVQQRLDAAEKRLHGQLEQLAKQRQAAVTAGDQPALAKIEATEAAAVKRYEEEINRVLNTSISNASPPSPAVNQRRPFAPRAQQAPEDSSDDRQPPRRRMKLWPFR